MATEIDLDLVVLTPAAFAAWQETAQRWAMAFGEMAARSRAIDPHSIPDERARINDNGTLTIFVNVSGVMSVEMDLPASQWAHRAHPN